MCCQPTYWVKFIPGTASPHRHQSSKRSSATCQPSNNAEPRGRGHTGVSGGFSADSFSGLAPPTSPRVKPQTKTTQLSADLNTLPGDGGTHGPEVDACTRARTHTHTHTHTRSCTCRAQRHPDTETHTTNHAQGSCPDHNPTVRSHLFPNSRFCL